MDTMRHEAMPPEEYDILCDIIDTMMDIYDEIDGGKKYIKDAMSHKSYDKQSADNLVALSAQELQHAEVLTGSVNRMMEKLKSTDNACYGIMHKVWNYMHQRQADYLAWVKGLHEQYKR